MISVEHSQNKTVVVGMSGGVDSSVAALLLKQQGYRVIGLFMKNWDEIDENGVCPAERDYEDVVRVCERLDIPYYSVEFVKEYWDNVFVRFLREYESGYTPNPDILCNREIKFNAFLKKALALGADYLATGHYCQVEHSPEGARLLKGIDPGKDQTYFLNAVDGGALERVLFPIGHLMKSQVRELALAHGLPTHAKKDSTGICFIGERDFQKFLSQYVQAKPGKIQTLSGEVVGEHAGVAYYTLGQRKGLGLGGEGDAWFVVAKDNARNIVYVERGSKHPAMYADDLVATELNWISGVMPTLPFRCKAKARYRQQDQDCVIEQGEAPGQVLVRFDLPQRALTPGQSVVFYDGETCLGGGVIHRIGPSYHERGLLLPERLAV